MLIVDRKSNKLFLSTVIGMLIVILSVTVAYAAFITIDTTDGVVDGDWSTTAFLSDPADDADDTYDILNFWVSTNGSSPTEFAFKVELDNWMTTSGNDFLEARLDCNHDGDFIDTEDLYIDYAPISDEVMVFEAPGTGDSYSLGSTYGEATATNYVYEWKSTTSTGSVDWATCLANSTNINVMLATVTFSGDFIDKDITGIGGYNQSTAITLQNFSGNPRNVEINSWILVLISICFLGLIRMIRKFRLETCEEN
ncbi:MAG: hypothetical protein JW908_15340 [Anaerolineales bacterium]|nr:hypothetical protein [Anaerolineales bacterium]